MRLVGLALQRMKADNTPATSMMKGITQIKPERLKEAAILSGFFIAEGLVCLP